MQNMRKNLLCSVLKSQTGLAHIVKGCLKQGFSAIATSKQFLKMDNFVWIDMEMTGLDPAKHTVLEIACIITTPELKPVHEGIHLIIHQSDEILNSQNDWSLKNHAKTGLTELSRKSNISLPQADEQVAEYIINHSEGNKYLAGNSVYMDRMFLKKYFPKVDSLLHYRILDVSSIKILCNNWYPDKILKLSKKNLNHRAFDDIKESIQELRNYKQEIFK